MRDLNRRRLPGPAILLAVLSAFLLSGYAQKNEDQESYYKKWLEQDVVYIIDPDEKRVFERLATDDERDQFIEQFWLRRDPNTSTAAINELKEEHYRRIAYANEHYHSGVDGWRTDRGMIYIRFGPPTGVEKYPEGGSYTRKPEEGGGLTYAFPFEVWFYNSINGVGQGISIEFVDFSRTNEYRIATDPDQKDALFHIPGAGATLAEALGTRSRLDRVRTRYLGNPEGGSRGLDSATRPLRYKDYPLQRLEQIYRLQRAPEVRYKDLEKIVSTRISYDQLPVTVRSDVIRLSDRVSLAPVTLFVPNKELSFKPFGEHSDFQVARITIYGRVENMGGRIVYIFEDDIERRLTREQLAREGKAASAFQKRLPLEPGRYKLSLVVREPSSGKLATLDHLIVVPGRADQLQTSSMMLTRLVTTPPEDSSIGDPFVIGKYRVVPEAGNRFATDDEFVQAYFEVYNLELDQTTLEPSARVEISLLKGRERVFEFQTIEQEFEFDDDRLLVFKTIPFRGLESGKYSLEFRITDRVGESTLERSVDFILN